MTSVLGNIGRAVCSRRPAEGEGVPDATATESSTRRTVGCCVVSAREDGVVETYRKSTAEDGNG